MVEDQPDDRQIIRDMLAPTDYEITKAGFVQNLEHPGFNLTGFSTFESSAGGKWLALLKEAAPKVYQ